MLFVGEVILNQEPYVCVPNKNSSDSSSKCDWCFNSSNIKKCSACQVVWYCSSSCQVRICSCLRVSVQIVFVKLIEFDMKMNILCS